MTLSPKQHGVVRGMTVGAILTVVAIVGTAAWHPGALLPDDNTVARLGFALKWAVLPGLCLMVSIGRLARHRFFTPEDIDGGGLSPGTENARVLQAVLQNTLEQSVLASLAYLIWVVTVPHAWLASLPAAAILFLIGRILFVRGYRHGAPARSLGFAMTFYPSVVLLVASAIELGRRLIVG